MEHIRQAVERARNPNPHLTPGPAPNAEPARQAPPRIDGATGPEADRGKPLDAAHLERNRIVAHDDRDRRAKSFHILRTHVAQEMAARGWQFLAVASPTGKCGRTTAALNLAISLARQPDRSIMLVDLNLAQPKIARRLGLGCEHGLVSTLLGQTTLSQAIVPVSIEKYRLLVLPCERETSNSSEWLASRAMATILQELRSAYRSATVLFDLPPVLQGDDALSILPHLDCALLVVALDVSTTAQIKACDEYLRSTEVVRLVVNGAPGAPAW